MKLAAKKLAVEILVHRVISEGMTTCYKPDFSTNDLWRVKASVALEIQNILSNASVPHQTVDVEIWPLVHRQGIQYRFEVLVR